VALAFAATTISAEGWPFLTMVTAWPQIEITAVRDTSKSTFMLFEFMFYSLKSDKAATVSTAAAFALQIVMALD
jgi:hypothetical protein